MIGKFSDQLIVIGLPRCELLEELTLDRHDGTGIGIVESAGNETVKYEIGCFALVQPGFPGIEIVVLARRNLIIDAADEIDRIIMFTFEMFGWDFRSIEGGFQ